MRSKRIDGKPKRSVLREGVEWRVFFVRTLAAFVLLLLGLLSTSASAQSNFGQFNLLLGLGHSDTVTSVAASPDGRLIVSGSEDSTVKLWDAASGRELRTFSGHSDPVTSVAFSPDGRTVATASVEGEYLKLWDVSSGKALQILSGRPANSVSFSPDGRTIVSGMKDLTLWDAASGRKLLALSGHSKRVASVAFSPDGRSIVSGSWDKTVKLWDASSGRELRTLSGHADIVTSVAFSSDGRSIVSGSWDKTVKLWDASSGRELRTLSGHSNSVTSVAFSPDGRTVATATDDGGLKLWDVSSGQELQTFRGHSGGAKSVAFSPDGRTIVSGGDDKAVRLWDASSGRRVRALGFQIRGNVEITSVAFSPDGRMVVSGSNDKTLNLWDAASGRPLRKLSGHSDAVMSVAISPDGRLIVSGSHDKTLKLWDASSGRELRTFSGHSDAVKLVMFSPDGRSILSGSSDKTAKLWDASSGRELRTFSGDSGSVTSVAFSPEGRTVATATDDGGLKLWDVSSGRELRKLSGHPDTVVSVAFSMDGRSILSGSSDNTVKLWDAASGRELRTFNGQSYRITSVAFSPDARTIVSGLGDGSLRRWTDGRLLGTSVARSDGEWLTMTPEGFFDASSPKASQPISIVRGVQAFSIDQFYNQLYRPDLVREKLAGDPNGKVREAAARLDLSKAVASGSAPRVGIAPPSSGTQVQGDQATVEAEISDQGGGIGKVEWRVNGVTLGVEERGIRRTDQSGSSGQGRTLRVSRTLGLTPGENKIAVLAYNEAGLIASEPAEITVTSVQQTAGKPRLYVLAVGVNDYWDSALKLSYAAPDAKKLGDGLRQAGGQLYEQVEVKTVLDGDATAAKLDGVFTELSKKVRPQDVFVFFLAGHGKTVDARFYFLPQDFRYAGEDSITKKAVGQNQLQDWVSRIKAQKSVLLFDACESGSLVGDKIAMRGIEEKTAIDRMTRAMGRTVLTATTDSKPAIEGYLGHGVFTYTVLAGFAAADTNGDGVVDVTELATYVDRRLPDLTYEAFKLRQVPQMSIVGSNFPLASKVALLPAAGASPTQSPAASVPTKSTHVVIAPAQAYEQLAGKGRKLEQLPPGTLVSLVKTDQGWVLVARDGKQIGYVAEDRLMRVQ